MLTEDQAIDQLTALATPNSGGDRYTIEQFQQLKTLLEENRRHFIFEPTGGMHGFFINVYRHPVFPRAPIQKLVRISGNRLPEELRIEEKIAPGRKLDDGMRELSPFSHAKENIPFLNQYGLEKPHDLSYYEY
jgi:hypothetical protein